LRDPFEWEGITKMPGHGDSVGAGCLHAFAVILVTVAGAACVLQLVSMPW
jgi:hypothetical protein